MSASMAVRRPSPVPPPPQHHSDTAPNNGKNSLGFICSPAVVLPSSSPTSTAQHPFLAPTTSTNSTPAPNPLKRKTRPLSSLESLPRSLLAHIALHLVIQEPAEPIWPNRRHPSALIPFFLTSRTIYDAISFDNNPQLYNNLFRASFDHSALDRRYEWMVKNLSQQAGRGRKIFDLFSDPRSWAIDYKTRWEQSSRMRRVAKANKYEGLCERDQLVADLWNVWFLLTENGESSKEVENVLKLMADGRNIQYLVKECAFETWIYVFYREDMLKDSLVPGYPRETGEKALATWCALISGADLSSETTPAEVDEKIFVMRPYVFACAKVSHRIFVKLIFSTTSPTLHGTIGVYPYATQTALTTNPTSPCDPKQSHTNDSATPGGELHLISSLACTYPSSVCSNDNPGEWG